MFLLGHNVEQMSWTRYRSLFQNPFFPDVLRQREKTDKHTHFKEPIIHLTIPIGNAQNKQM